MISQGNPFASTMGFRFCFSNTTMVATAASANLSMKGSMFDNASSSSSTVPRASIWASATGHGMPFNGAIGFSLTFSLWTRTSRAKPKATLLRKPSGSERASSTSFWVSSSSIIVSTAAQGMPRSSTIGLSLCFSFGFKNSLDALLLISLSIPIGLLAPESSSSPPPVDAAFFSLPAAFINFIDGDLRAAMTSPRDSDLYSFFGVILPFAARPHTAAQHESNAHPAMLAVNASFICLSSCIAIIQ